MNRDSVVKIAVVSLGGLLLLWLLNTILTGTAFGNGMHAGGNMMVYNQGGGNHMWSGSFNGGGFSYILILLIKILFVVFVIGLVGGIVAWVKNSLFTDEDKAKLRQAFVGNKEPITLEVCSICGKEMEPEWKACPYCGKEK